ncbi:MAG: TMEM165/GDT1 family protein [Deltaproteobacteria bacterium]|jgi:putative Ca2+/H+ antiporter (TMEM165/GDT1 family)|nr:TMEM165/GDT1 family protein [Deltaproteobacteria bacterium]
MDWQSFLTVFATVFIAELGDKTQLATLLFASDYDRSRLTVFLAASAALIVASGVGVLAGGALSRFVSPTVLQWVAGVGFIGIGVWVLLSRS